MIARTCLTIVLAAGEGTRMRAARPKVLHTIGGTSLIGHVLAAAGEIGGAVAVVVGPAQNAVVRAARAALPGVGIFVQQERRGTAHAVLAARSVLVRGADDVLVVFADTPLITAATLARLRETLASGAAVTVLGFRPADPTGYGRLIVNPAGALLAIREEKDASPDERRIELCNAGLMALSGRTALAILDRIGDDNAKREFYLTDAVAIAGAMGLATRALETEEDEVRGVNTQAQLAEAEAALQRRLRAAAHEAGVVMVAPDTVHLCADTKLGRNVTIEPYVVFGPGVTIEDGAVIRSFSHIEGAHVGPGARVGPFARLRPGARLDADVHIGNFVEIKEARFAAGAKANHLAYIGDASVGAAANIGAGTITCNYDGHDKHRTEIGDGAFIGSNSALVAPVKIGERAYIGSGSVITRDVPADALAFGRARQSVKEGWAARLRTMLGTGKKRRHERGGGQALLSPSPLRGSKDESQGKM
jgi:bifunctional UDP-N-acetylglucosamine pyrophosphorylase/glucosamine-1-phosphate N-acetyltransferase